MSEITQRKVEWHPKTIKGISQVPKDGLEYAFVSKDHKQVHQLIWCKDFMQDAIFGFINKFKIEIYGFEYDPNKNPPVYLDKTRIMVCNWRDHDFGKKLLNNCQEFLHDIEDQLKMSKTTFEKCINPPPIYRKSGVYIIEGDKRWMSAPPMISLYTLMIRIGLVHVLGQSYQKTLSQIKEEKIKPYNWKPDTITKYGNNHDDNDADYLILGKSGLDKIIKYDDRNIFHPKIEDNYPEFTDIFNMHDDCGLGGYSSGTTEEFFSYWHRLEK